MNNDLDLLGLGQGDLDILGLGSRPVPVISSAPPDEGSFLGDLWDRFATDKEGEKAKAANALSLSEATGLPPSVVYDRMDEITKEMGLRDQPPFRDLIERPIMGAVTYGLLAHPMATVVGVASFGALAEAENYLVSRKEGIPYQFGAGRGLADMLPEETAQGYKDLIWTADMAWKAVAAGGAIKGAKPAVEKFAVKYMRDVTETYNLPRNVYISPEKIREFHGLGRENIISTEEATMLKEMGLTRQQYVDGLKYGLDLEIPAEKLVTMVDKPWWAAMKGLFKVSPYEETVVTRGKATGDKAVSGLLGEPEAAPKPAEFLTEQAATGTSPAEVGKVAAAEIVQPGANLKVIYHGTDKTFEEFDITKSADGSIWFTDNKSKIENGEVAATGKGIIVERLIDENNLKLGGWDEADKYSTDELISQGYDGLKLVDEEETTYQIFNPEKLKGATSQAMKLEKPSEKGTANIPAKEKPVAEAETGKPITMKVYHGSPDARFSEEFDPNKKGYYPQLPDALPDNSGWISLYGRTGGGFRAKSATGNVGVSFTDDRKTAQSYANKPAFDYQNSVPMILERYVTLNNPKVLNLAGKEWDLKLGDEIKKAIDEGHDGLVFKNIRDDYNPSDRSKATNNVIVFDPSQISLEPPKTTPKLEGENPHNLPTAEAERIIQPGVTGEDFELHPDRMKNLKPGYLSFQVDGKTIAAKIGSKVNGQTIYNHSDLGVATGLDFDKAVPGFLDKKGRFVEQYPAEPETTPKAVGGIIEIEKTPEANYFSGTDNEPITSIDQIVPYGKSLGYSDNHFGGLFAGSEGVAESHGVNIQKFYVPKDLVMSHDAMSRMLYDQDEAPKLLKTISEVIKKDKHEMLSDKELSEIADYLSEEKKLFRDTPDMGEERMFEILGRDSIGEADWDIQGLRGEVARRLGYAAVEMEDEHGITTLILNHPGVKLLPNPSRPPEGGGRIETPAPEEISSIDYDDPNTLLEMAARSDEVAMPPQTTEYDKIRAQAASIAFENLSKKIDLKKRREAAAIRRQGIEDARSVPVFAAMDEAIKGGGLNRGWLEKIYDREMVNELARKRVGLVTKDGPFGLDQIAQMHGYDYADTLMNDLLAWEGLKAEGVKAAETFEEKYYDLLSEAEKEDFHLALLEEEAKILRKMIKATGKPSTPGIKKVIREQTGQTRVEELTVSEYDALKAGMKKAEQASRKAFREGKIEGALAEKERQIEMAETRKAKLEAKEESKGIHDDIVRLTKDKSIPEDYRDRITSLLEDFDILPRSKKTAQRVESAREFLERQKQAGEDVTIPESMLNRIERYGKTHWRELTLDQLREIHDQAKMYEHLGKMKNKLLKARQKKDFEATVQGLIDEISKNWGIKQAGPADIEAMFLEPSALEGMGQFKDSYLGSLTKVETYLRRLDGFKDMGPVWERTYLPVKEASDAEYRNLADITGKLQKLFEPMKKTLTKVKFKIPGVNQFVTRETVIMVALNSGNEGNLNALKNTIYKWDDAQIQAILNNVTPDEWKLVRGIWDLFEEQFPKLSEVYKNLSGVNLKKVEGDYFPLVFDRKLSWIADKNATEQELRDFFKSIYTRPSVKSGSTIERVGGTLPPKLKFTVIFDKLAEINHYITHAEAVRDVQKILGDPRVRAAIEGTPAGIGGAVGYREMMTWLQDVARQKADPLSAVESAIKTARINTTAVAMAWKFSTAAVQWLGMGNSIYKLGMGEVAKGMAEFYTNREATVERIKGLSAEMSGRAKSFDRELRDAYNRIGLEHFRGSMALKDSFFSLISLMDMAVAYPTWVAAYNKGMKDYSDETKAVEFADMTVRMTQGNALAKDLAGIQRGSELKKIMSMFYTFFSAYHQMMSDAWLKFKFDKTGQNFSDLVKAWWWLTILPASMDYLMKERDVPSPGDFLKNVLQMRLTAYPVIRDLTGAVLTDYDYQFSPVARAGEVVARGAKEVVKLFTPGEEAEFDKLLKYGIESAGYMFGLPTGQAVVTMQGLIDLMNGETSDPTRLMFRAPREEE